MIGKKLISSTLAVTTFVWLFGASFAPVASAQTTAELQAQIASLLAQIAALQAQLGGGTTTPTTSFQFTRNLTVGSTGNDVKELQKFLNSKGFVVSVSGAGSVGNESTYFGYNTKAALVKFQAANGISATGFFGPITMAKVNSMIVVVVPPPGTTPPPTTTPGVEGTLTAKLYASPVGAQIKEGNKDVQVMGIELEAKTSSMTIQRVDVKFATTTRPNLPFERVSLVVDGSVIATKQITSVDDFTKGTDNMYTLRFGGLSQVVGKDTKKVITVTVSGKDDIESTYEGTWTLEVPINGIRAVDGAGIQHEVSTAAIQRTFTVLSTAAGDLEVSLNSANKDSAVVFLSESSQTSNVELLAFNVKARESNVTINDVTVNVSSTDADAPVIAKLYKGSDLIGSEAITMTSGSSTVTFDDLTVAIAKDATQTFYVKVDLNSAGTNYATVSAGARVHAQLSGNIVYEYGANGTVGNEAVTTSGNDMYLYVKAPVVAGGTKETLTALENNSKIANGNLVFTVTAQGGDIYVAEASTTVTSAASSTVEGDWIVSGATETTSGSNIWMISSGATATITIPVALNNTGGTASVFGFAEIGTFAWGTTSGAQDTAWTEAAIKMVDDVETNALFLTN